MAGALPLDREPALQRDHHLQYGRKGKDQRSYFGYRQAESRTVERRRNCEIASQSNQKKEQVKLFADGEDTTPVHGGAVDIPAVMADGTKNY